MKHSRLITAVIASAAIAPVMAQEYYSYYTPPVAASVARPLVYSVDAKTVIAVQDRLLARGYTVPLDGIFDAYTADALRHFQQLQGFAPTGIIDRPTLIVLGIDDRMPATLR